MVIRDAMPKARRGPVEVRGNGEELFETARVMGFTSPTAWRIVVQGFYSVFKDEAPKVLISPSQFEKLAERVVELETTAISHDCEMGLRDRPNMLHTGVLAVEDRVTGIQQVVADTVLSYMCKPRSEPAILRYLE